MFSYFYVDRHLGFDKPNVHELTFLERGVKHPNYATFIDLKFTLHFTRLNCHEAAANGSANGLVIVSLKELYFSPERQSPSILYLPVLLTHYALFSGV